MQFSKKSMAIIGLVIILAASNIAFAMLYMTKIVNISGGVYVAGAMAVYDEDGVTPLASYDFPMFTAGVQNTFSKYFFINSTGSSPVYVYWNISSSSIDWQDDEYGYIHREGEDTKYSFILWRSPTDQWTPNEFFIPEAVYLEAGQGLEIQIELDYTGIPSSYEGFSLAMSFYAQDA